MAGISLGGIIVILGIILAIVWSPLWGIIIALIGLLAFGGFAKGRWSKRLAPGRASISARSGTRSSCSSASACRPSPLRCRGATRFKQRRRQRDLRARRRRTGSGSRSRNGSGRSSRRFRGPAGRLTSRRGHRLTPCSACRATRGSTGTGRRRHPAVLGARAGAVLEGFGRRSPSWRGPSRSPTNRKRRAPSASWPKPMSRPAPSRSSARGSSPRRRRVAHRAPRIPGADVIDSGTVVIDGNRITAVGPRVRAGAGRRPCGST